MRAHTFFRESIGLPRQSRLDSPVSILPSPCAVYHEKTAPTTTKGEVHITSLDTPPRTQYSHPSGKDSFSRTLPPFRIFFFSRKWWLAESTST